MKIVLKYVSKNIIEKKGRSLLILFSLIIASTVMILNLTIPNQIVDANENKIKNLVGESDIVLGGFNYFNINDININNDTYEYVGVNQNNIIHKDKTLTLYGTDLSKASKLKLVEKNDLLNNEVIISESTAQKFDYKIGDIVKLEINDQTYELKVKYIESNKGLLYFKTYSMIMNNQTFNDLNNIKDQEKYISYYINLSDESKIDNFNDYINKNNDDYFSQKLVDKDTIKDNNAYVSLILIIIFVMSVIMIFFVVSTLNKMIIMERTPVIATFRSIGATKFKMNTILVLENALYGLIGGVLGSLLSIIINNMCVKLLLGGETLYVNVPLENLIIGIVFSIILEIVMSIGAIIKSNKYSIKQLLFENPSSKYELSKLTSLISIVCITLSIVMHMTLNDDNVLIDLLTLILFWIGVANFIPLLMTIFSKIFCVIAKKLNNGSLVIASKNLGHNKMVISSGRLVIIAISIMLVIFSVSSRFDNMLNSFRYQFGDYDIFIRDTTKLNSEYEEALKIDEVEKFELVYMTTSEKAYNNNKELSTPPIILGMKDSRPDIIEEDYKIKDLKENEILVDKKYLSSNNWKIGDTINIRLSDYNNTNEYKIVGTINSFYYSVQREVMVVNENHFLNNYTKVPFQITLDIKDGVDIDKAVKKLEYQLKDPDIVIMTVDGFVNDQRKNINTIMYLFYVIIVIILVLSFVSIINNQIISFIERTKELAVLNSICMSKNQLNLMLIVENALNNIIACGVGLGVSIISVSIMNSVLNGIKLYIDVTFDYNLATTFIGIILVILLLTVILPIIKLRKINVVEAIKYE